VLLTLALGFLYNTGSISMDTLEAVSTIATSFLFSTAALAYLALKGFSPRAMISELKFDNFSNRKKLVAAGLLLFVIVLLLELSIGLFQVLTGIQLPTNVDQLLSGLPLYLLVFSIVIAPINEELLFRGLLVPRVGILVSAVLFALPHLLVYSSVSELIGAFAFGLIAGYAFKKTGSIYPSIIAHILVNTLAIVPLIH
jgi:membrane protease YdiL (CAAX protease family)